MLSCNACYTNCITSRWQQFECGEQINDSQLIDDGNGSGSQSSSSTSTLFTQGDEAWYKLPVDELILKLDLLNSNAHNRYVSPLLVGDDEWQDFGDIPLYAVALHFDACLDDMITLAKRWKGIFMTHLKQATFDEFKAGIFCFIGKVSLDVLEDLPHGFLNFISFSEEARRGCDLTVSRIRQALQLPPIN